MVSVLAGSFLQHLLESRRGTLVQWGKKTRKSTQSFPMCPLSMRHLIIKDYSTLGVRYRDLQARIYKQETRNLTRLKFECIVCQRVLMYPDNARTKSAVNVLIFSLSKPLI